MTAVVSAGGAVPAEWGKQLEGGVGRGGVSGRGHLSANLKDWAQSSIPFSYTSPHHSLTMRVLSTDASEVYKALRFLGPCKSKNSNLSLSPSNHNRPQICCQIISFTQGIIYLALPALLKNKQKKKEGKENSSQKLSIVSPHCCANSQNQMKI